MKPFLTIILGIILTLLASQPIMTVLQEVIVPHGYQVIAASPGELRSEVIGFAFAIGACISAWPPGEKEWLLLGKLY